MEQKVRWRPTGPGALVGVRLQSYMPALLALLVLTVAARASASSEADSNATHILSASKIARQLAQAAWSALDTVRHSAEALPTGTYSRAREGRWEISDVAWGGALVCAVQGLILWKMTAATTELEAQPKTTGSTNERPSSLWAAWKVNPEMEAQLSDPGLLQKFSTFQSYRTSKASYNSIRTFYRPHSQADKLPSKPSPLPLLVFVHGLGGCLASFTPLLTSLINVAPCLGVDLPGCGRSEFSPRSWDAYTPEALSELLCVIIEQHCPTQNAREIILIGHSMGCSLSLLVATSHSAPQNKRGFEVISLVGICPQATPPSGKAAARYSKLLRIPTWIFDVMRTLDRRKGLDSASVTQFTGKDADLELKRIQVKYNRQSRTPVFRRMAWGALSRTSDSSAFGRGLPGLDTWSKVKVPVFLVAGEGDTVTKPEEIIKIAQALGKVNSSSIPLLRKSSNGDVPGLNGHIDQPSPKQKRQSVASNTEVTVLEDAQDSPAGLSSDTPTYYRKRQVLKTSILPAPASHALLYDPSNYRTLAGLIQTFLSDHVDERLSLGWQLQHLSTEGKWDVKNLAKWQAIQPVSEPIAGIFRAMKTLREIDELHCPENFVKEWKSRIQAVVDISHESPVYDPKGLDEGGIEYYKFPTVSKIPPTEEEVKDFIKLIDKLRDQQPASSDNTTALIGVHCHYGFNRTGFFICCYLIEKEKYGVQQAVDAFAQGRPKGIKHAHFLDQLFVRYCIGLKRAPTL